jgi:hypothetical protein
VERERRVLLHDIFPVQTINAAQTSKLKSEDDGNGMRKKMAKRSVSHASTAFAAANASITEESSGDDNDDDLLNYTLHISSMATRSKSDEPKKITSVIIRSAKSDKAEEIASVISGSTFAAAKMKFTIPFPNDKNAGVVVELRDKEKRAMNKKIKEEVLLKIPQFKAELSVSNAFRPEHWKVLLSQMENGGDYTNQLFFGQSRVNQGWRAETLVKARAKLGIGIIRVKEGGRALGETTAIAAHSAIEVTKRVTSTHTLCISDDVAANDVAVGQVVLTLEAI